MRVTRSILSAVFVDISIFPIFLEFLNFFDRFKHLVVKKGPCVILVQDYKNNVFGGFLNEDFEYTHTQYKGSAECFLFKWKFEKDKRILKPFLATFQNEFFFYASSDGFGFGAE